MGAQYSLKTPASFDRTYEGLKLSHGSPSFFRTRPFDRTYEGLKRRERTQGV